MPVGLGHKTFIGLGEETAYGTPVARTKFLEIATGGDGLSVTEERIETQSVKEIGIRGDIDVRQGMVSVEGPLTLEAPYDGAELLLKHAFGSVASSQPDPVGDPTVWQHVFDIADALPTGLSIEVQRDIAAFLAEGAKINTLEFAIGGPDELLRVTAEILGEDVSTVSASTPTLPAVGKFHAPEAVLRWNAAQLKVSEFSIKLDNKLDADRRFIGSRFRSEPTRSAKIEVTGSFTAEFENTALYDDFRSAANRALQVKFTGPGIGAATRKYELTLDCPVSKLTEYPINVDNEGRITVEVAFKAYRDAANKELKLTFQNLTAGPI